MLAWYGRTSQRPRKVHTYTHLCTQSSLTYPFQTDLKKKENTFAQPVTNYRAAWRATSKINIERYSHFALYLNLIFISNVLSHFFNFIVKWCPHSAVRRPVLQVSLNSVLADLRPATRGVSHALRPVECHTRDLNPRPLDFYRPFWPLSYGDTPFTSPPLKPIPVALHPRAHPTSPLKYFKTLRRNFLIPKTPTRRNAPPTFCKKPR